MNVKQLIKKLQKLDPTLQVILQKDSEGNGYSPLYGVDDSIIKIDGEIHSTDFTAEEMFMDEKEWKKIKENKKNRVVVLFPVN